MEWFVLRVESRKAKRVAEGLGGLYPVWRRWTKPSRKRRPVISEVPCFPGWVFAPMDRYEDGAVEEGVLGVMKYGRRGPLILTEEDMARIREIQGMEDIASCEEKRATPDVGDLVDVGWGLMGEVVGVNPVYADIDVGGSMLFSWHY